MGPLAEIPTRGGGVHTPPQRPSPPAAPPRSAKSPARFLFPASGSSGDGTAEDDGRGSDGAAARGREPTAAARRGGRIPPPFSPLPGFDDDDDRGGGNTAPADADADAADDDLGAVRRRLSSSVAAATTAEAAAAVAAAAAAVEERKRTHVYVRDDAVGWIPAELLREEGRRALVVKRRDLAAPRAAAGEEDSNESRGGGDANTSSNRRRRRRHPEVDFTRGLRGVVDEAMGGSGGGDDDGDVGDVVSSASEPDPLDSAAAVPLGFDDAHTAPPERRPDDAAAEWIDLSPYPSRTLPLQDVDEETGRLRTHDDMVDLPYLHEAAILYNLKARYEGSGSGGGGGRTMDGGGTTDEENESRCGCPYTRTGDILVSINPYRWIHGLYAERTRRRYAEELVWRGNPGARKTLPPHLYEVSSLAFRGLVLDGLDQSILVSGESGAGKTVAVKILMSHLATFHETRRSGGGASSAHAGGEDCRAMEEEGGNEGESGAGGLGGAVGATVGSVLSWVTGLLFGFVYAPVSPTAREGGGAAGPGEVVDLEAGGGSSAFDAAYDDDDVVDDEPEEMSQTNVIVQRVLDSNPLMEAFGNAKTSLNSNSSRFGKYVKLQFRTEYAGRAYPKCTIAGSRCETYLLEKSRVVRHDVEGGERTFHVFYQLLEGAPEAYKASVWEGLAGTDASSFRYVVANGAREGGGIEGRTDAQLWRKTRGALGTIGLDAGAVLTLMRALCAVLQLGNVTFVPDPSNEGDGSIVASGEEAEKLSAVLGVPAEEIGRSFTHRTVSAGRNETYHIPNTTARAGDVRDALAKEIYGRIFDWLVGAINDATCAEKNYRGDDDGDASSLPSSPVPDDSSTPARFGLVGLLDIFGFECFPGANRYEQLLINHANERLQRKFTEDVFQSVREEYRSEGIDMAEVRFEDNGAVLELLEGRLGLIDLLNEECFRPQGSDAGFVNKVYAHNKHSSSSTTAFSASASSSLSPLIRNKRYGPLDFGVAHYAGPVTYHASSFVLKNVDTLPEDVVTALGVSSGNALIREGMRAWQVDRKTRPPPPSGPGAGGRKGALIGDSVWTKFTSQLGDLMGNVRRTRTRYVRCINPNAERRAGVVDAARMSEQLRCAGLVAAVSASRATFPNRLSFEDVLGRFRFLAERAVIGPGSSEDAASTIGGGSSHPLLARLLGPGGRSEDIDADARRRRRREVARILLEYLLLPYRGARWSSSGRSSAEADANDDVSAFVVGRTKVFFRSGALEYLESERLRAFDRCATVIQCRVRRNTAAVRYEELKLSSPTEPSSSARLRQRAGARRNGGVQSFLVAVFVESNPIVPFAILLFGKFFGLSSLLGNVRRR